MSPEVLHVLVSRVACEAGFSGGYGIGTTFVDGEEYAVALRLTRYEVGQLAARLFAAPDGEVLAQVPRASVYLCEPVHRDSPEMPSWPTYDAQTRQRGQALSEFAVVTAIALPLLLVASTIAVSLFQTYRLQNAVTTGAVVVEQLDAEVARVGLPDCLTNIEENDGVRVVRVTCRNPLDFTSTLIPTISAEASAPVLP